MGYTKAFAKVLRNENIAPGIYDLLVKTPQAADAQAGQFVEIYCPGKTLRRPISICEIDKVAGTLRMVYMVKGEGTLWLSQVKVGDTLDLLGPLGHGFDLSQSKDAIVIGGGIGVPPMLETAKLQGKQCDAILGFRTASAAILLDDFEQVCNEVMLCTDDGTLGLKGFVTDILEKRLASRQPFDLVCACGPMVMLKNVAKLCEKYNVSCQVSLEERMGCGIGACVGCAVRIQDEAGTVRSAQVCRYGPVMDAKEVVW